MEFDRLRLVLAAAAAALCLAAAPGWVLAGDIAHDDELAPKQPGCKNVFVLVGICMPFLFFFVDDDFCCGSGGSLEIGPRLRCYLDGFSVER